MSEYVFGKTFTTKELTDATGYSAPSISRIALKYGYETVQPSKTGTNRVWSMDFYLFLKKYVAEKEQIKAREERRKARLGENKNESLEELKKEHPLVTDERCFKLNFWPETVPNNLVDFIGG